MSSNSSVGENVLSGEGNSLANAASRRRISLATALTCAPARASSSRRGVDDGGAREEVASSVSASLRLLVSRRVVIRARLRLLLQPRRQFRRRAFSRASCDLFPVNGETSPLTEVGLCSADAGRISERPDEGAAWLRILTDIVKVYKKISGLTEGILDTR